MHLAPQVAALFLLATIAASSGFSAAPAESTDDPVKMAPFRVEASSLNFGFGLSTWLGSNGARHAMITRVDRGSLAERAGLLVADRLISVEGKLLASCDAAGLMKLFNRTVNADAATSWLLTVERGLSGKSVTVKLLAKAGTVGPDSPAGSPLVIVELASVAPAVKPAPAPNRR